jgi:imidazolonepropionase-like amidohydrolase
MPSCAMRSIAVALSTTAFLSIAFLVAPRAQSPVERGTLLLHYVQKEIGAERYTIARDRDTLTLAADFDFTDRGGRIQLASTLTARDDFTPIHFTAKGRSYRYVNVDSDVTIDGTTAIVRADGKAQRVPLPPAFYTVDGYAPLSAQMLMLRYWNRHGRPRTLQTVPGLPIDEVTIELRGREAMRTGSKLVTLDRYAIDGVVWGRETVWLDESGSLAAAITRAGGLGFEAVRDDLEPLLAQFVERATRDRIGDLEAIAAQNPPLRSGAYAMVGGTLVDGTGRAPVANAAIVVRDGRIVDVGPRATVTLPAGIQTVDMTGKTIVPGLWDMHTHVTQVEWAPVYLAAGVTTARDMGNEFAFITVLRDAIAAKRAIGPRLLLAGLVDGGGPDAFGVTYAATPDEAKKAVAMYQAAGFQQMKIYSLITPPIVEAIAVEAHRAGMTVTGHVPNGMTIVQAAAAGMDQIAHLPIRGEAGSDDVTRTIAFLKERGTVIDPTQSWNELLGHAAGTPVSAFQPGIEKVPPPLNRIFSNAGATGIDAATARARLERGLRIVKALHDAGVPVVVGTDEGIPGHSVHREIELYVEAGLTPMEALQAATIVPARAMKLDGELGTIEKGKRADMAVLNANPLDNIRNIRAVRWTISDGRVYDAPALWESVRFLP